MTRKTASRSSLRSPLARAAAAGLAAGLVLVAAEGLRGQSGPRGWQKGKGWGWIWGKNDEVGALNAQTPESIKRALALVKRGKVYDLGIGYDRTSFKFAGHSPGEVMRFRSPEGLKRGKDVGDVVSARAGTAWHSSALFISDNVATQIDGLGHITTGQDDHWYNGFREADHGTDFGIRKADAAKIPPIIARGVLVDVAGWKKVDALPGGTAITAEDIKAALKAQKIDVQPGDAVFVRTGTLRYWGDSGSNHEKLKAHDSAGIDLGAARYLVEDRGAIFVGGDTSGLEVGPAPAGGATFIPVHEYLLIEQGVHIGEFHNLEELARDRVHEFCYIATTNKIRGAVAGFALRPLALR
jgi:kynurenine formamidase